MTLGVGAGWIDFRVRVSGWFNKRTEYLIVHIIEWCRAGQCGPRLVDIEQALCAGGEWVKFLTPASFVPAIVVLITLTAAENARADASRGRALAEQRCSQCHGVKKGEKSPAADAPSFTDVAAEPSITEYMLRVFLQTPHPTMPNLIIKPDEMDDLVSYIVSLKPKH